MDAVLPSSKKIVYRRSMLSSDEAETSRGKGISITVPESNIFVMGSIRSTWVPGVYFSSN